MKGPYERLKYDFRRVFECPRCQRRVRMPGNVTFVTCSCSENTSRPESSWMQLVEDDTRRTDGRRLAIRSRWPACPDGRFPDDPIPDDPIPDDPIPDDPIPDDPIPDDPITDSTS